MLKIKHNEVDTMNTFSWLLLGHLLGDWLLQNDWMAQGKRRGFITAAGMAHFATYTAAVVGTLWLAGSQGLSWAVLFAGSAVVFVSHWLIDATNIVHYWMRLYGQQDQAMVRMMIDQTWHLLVLGLLAVFLF